MINKKIHYIISIGLIVIGLSVFLYPWIFDMPKVLDWNYANLQKIKKQEIAGDSFNFAIFGDNKNSVFAFPKLIKKVNEQNISFSAETGDLIDNMIDGKSEYKIYLSQIAKLKKPFLTVPGNHETEGMSSAYCYLFGRNYYAFSHKNSYFLMLDGSHETGMGNEEMHWLGNELKKSQKYKHVFALMHIPIYDPLKGEVVKSQFDKKPAKELYDLFSKYHIDMIFTAHLHGYFTGKWGNIPYTVTGGAGAELGGSDPKHFFHHFVLVKVNGDNVSYEVKKVGNNSNTLVAQFINNVKEFVTMYLLAHWDLFLVIIGLLYLLIYSCIIRGRDVRNHN